MILVHNEDSDQEWFELSKRYSPYKHLGDFDSLDECLEAYSKVNDYEVRNPQLFGQFKSKVWVT